MTEHFFNPNSIAIIGATADPKKFGNAVTVNLLENPSPEYKLFPVNPKGEMIANKQAYTSILNIEEEVDLAIILVPAKAVEIVVDECIQKKVKRIVIVTAGFGEIDEQGKEVEKRIIEKCRSNSIRVIGPNCVGIQNVEKNMNASFIKTPRKGNISMVTQSGSVGAIVLYELEWQGLGFAKFANLGNMADMTLTDILDYFKEDQKSEVITVYLENVKDGREFYDSLKEVAEKKPTIVLKGGRTSTGMKAASSHTGSIATNYSSLRTAVKQAGAFMCENIPDYITAIKTFSLLPIPTGNKIAVSTNSGGSSVMFSDYADEFDLELAEFTEDFKQKIEPHIIPLVKKVNPLDLIAGANGEAYYQITKIMLEDPNIDIVVPCCVVPTFLGMTIGEHYAGIIRAWNETGRQKPIIPLFSSGELLEEAKKIAEKERAPLFYNPREAAYAIRILLDRKKITEK